MPPLFAQSLGPAMDNLPGPVQDLHDVLAHCRWTGVVRIDRGPSLGTRPVCAVVEFSPDGASRGR
ncbi:hypothetical protein [Jannaschia rubra]|uniref:hypothetical protein n=1 Tax=Jannaschia rubra TaxID=282197 RepID=UPI0024923C8E|nr:hypothetical protein [Jannaschia rubra]